MYERVGSQNRHVESVRKESPKDSLNSKWF